MKRYIILFIAFAVLGACGVKAQRPVTSNFDTVQGNETVYITVVDKSTSNRTLTLSALCTELGGTSDGTITLEGSVDGTNFVPLTDQAQLIKGYPNDSLTITDGAVTSFVILENRYYTYRLKVAGTASDTTLVQTTWLDKTK